MKKILIVDDCEMLRAGIKLALEDIWSGELLEVDSAARACEALKKEQDIVGIFCEYNLQGPEGGGLVVYDFVKEQHRQLFFVLMGKESMQKEDFFKAKYRLGPFCDYLKKPLKEKELKAVFEKMQKQLWEGEKELPLSR